LRALTRVALTAVSSSPRRLIWLEEHGLDKLNSIRRAGESCSETIIRLAAL
jgi:hypothetical protein